MSPEVPAAVDGEPGSWLHEALREHEDRTLRRVTAARTVAFVCIGIWIYANYGAEVGNANLLPMALFVLLGLAAFTLMHRRPERAYLSYLFVVLDVLLLAYVLFAPGRTYPESWPWPISLRLSLFLFFLTFPALAALTFRPALVAWAGAVASAALAASAWLIARSPGAVFGMRDLAEGALPDEGLDRYLAPAYVHPDDVVVRVSVILLLSAIMAYGAARARQLVFEQAAAARERANLARYVAPSMVDSLARRDNPLGATRSQEAAVLFCDIAGFTALAEHLPAEEVMELLRGFHGRMAGAVFAQAGTVDKFVGDGLMATFGTPETAPDDAERALTCAQAMLAELDAWNAERARAGRPPVRAGIGLHAGPVVTGDIGGAGRFEFAVIGDTVNVAERLQGLTRELGASLVASDTLLRQAGVSDPAAAGFLGLGGRCVRGRVDPLVLWASPQSAAPALARADAPPMAGA